MFLCGHIGGTHQLFLGQALQMLGNVQCPTVISGTVLSCVPIPDIIAFEFTQSLQDVDHTGSLALSDDRLPQFKHASANDPVMQVFGEITRHGWPERKSDVPESMHAYINLHDELTVQDHLVFKGACLPGCSICFAQRNDGSCACIPYWNGRLHQDGPRQPILATHDHRAEGIHCQV